jgi:hypothetical protein
MTERKEQQGVTPPSPIINRRTGKSTLFGARRAYDGAYVLELLNATGCTAEEAATVATVLAPLLENCDRVTVETLLNLLSTYEPYELPEWPKLKPRLTVID